MECSTQLHWQTSIWMQCISFLTLTYITFKHLRLNNVKHLYFYHFKRQIFAFYMLLSISDIAYESFQTFSFKCADSHFNPGLTVLPHHNFQWQFIIFLIISSNNVPLSFANVVTLVREHVRVMDDSDVCNINTQRTFVLLTMSLLRLNPLWLLYIACTVSAQINRNLLSTYVDVRSRTQADKYSFISIALIHNIFNSISLFQTQQGTYIWYMWVWGPHDNNRQTVNYVQCVFMTYCCIY